MPELVRIDIAWICNTTGFSISEINRVSGVSRNTLHRLANGNLVRRSTALRLLESIYHRNRCEPIRPTILEMLVDLESEISGEKSNSDILADLNEAVHEIATIERISTNDFEKLVELSEELAREVKKLNKGGAY